MHLISSVRCALNNDVHLITRFYSIPIVNSCSILFNGISCQLKHIHLVKPEVATSLLQLFCVTVVWKAQRLLYSETDRVKEKQAEIKSG